MAKKNYYAVASGKRTGIFDSWDEARPLVERVRGALHKGFATRDDSQEVCRARDDFDANDGEYFPKLTGTLTDWENEIYLYLLKQYGQPLTGNFYAVREFKREFGYRKWESVRTHVNRFNGGQTTHKTGPRGGKIKSTVYKDWVAAHGGEWVGFQWRPL